MKIKKICREYGLKPKILKNTTEYIVAKVDDEKVFIYDAKFKFKKLNETNIPVKLFRKIPTSISTLLVILQGKLYWLNKDLIVKKARINKKLKIAIYPISLDNLKELSINKPEPKEKTDNRFVHLHAHCDYCLSGDTLIYHCCNHYNNGVIDRTDYTHIKKCKTIKQLFKHHKKWGDRYNPYKIKVFDGEKFVASKITDIRFSGKKQTFKITTEKGKSISASVHHKFLTDNGWKRLGELNIGDNLACNGQPIYRNKEWLKKKYHDEKKTIIEIANECGCNRTTITVWLSKYDLTLSPDIIRKRDYDNRKINKKHPFKKNPNVTPNFSRSLAREQYLGIECERCGLIDKTKKKLVIHHKDENPNNNKPNNLETNCWKCHNTEHQYRLPYTIIYEKIKSIEKNKIEDTYDIEVEHRCHNFIANGIVTHNSLSDGIGKTRDYLAMAKQFGMPAMAITDHGNVSSHMDLQLSSTKLGIKPIFGVEMYIVNDAKIHDGDHRTSNHIVLLAKDEVGYRNLLKLQKISWSDEYYYYRPRIDYDSLKEYSEGLVVLTACIKGLLGYDLINKDIKSATKKAKWLHKVFGDDLYFEIQLHNIYNEDVSVDIQKVYNKRLIMLAKKLGINTVITNDVHYQEEGMEVVQSKVVKIKREGDLSEAYCDSIWFKNYDDMYDTWKNNCSYIPEKVFNTSMANTYTIACKCNYEIPVGGLRIPTIDITEFPGYEKGESLSDYITKRALKGLKKYKDKLADKRIVYLKRIKYELDAFEKMDVLSYILIYDDLVRYLKGRGCLCSLRGSANGSVILWLIGVSIVDPIKYKILFERFVSPARIEARMADIDIDLDISHIYRDEAIQYLKDKYGDDHICSVGSFGRTQLKAAIKGLARVEATLLKDKIKKAKTQKLRKKLERKLEPFDYQTINKVTKIMPDNIDDIEENADAKEWFDANRKWFDRFVRPILGNAYSESLHPAGVIISPEPYDEWLPVRSNKLSAAKGGHRVFASQWENSHTFEEFLNERGVMVMDILGVKTLTVISEAIKFIKEKHGKQLDLETLPTNDKEVYKSLANGENLGLFQLGSEKLKGYFKQIKPDNLEDINFFIAADRPGPLAAGAIEKYADRKHGREKINYTHPSMKAVTEDTQGVLVYSEHIMKSASEFAGMDPIKSEQMRKVIKAKNPEEFLKYKEEFINGAIEKWGK